MFALCCFLLSGPTIQTVPLAVDLAFPVDMALHQGLLYVVDFHGHRAWAIDPKDGRPLRQYGRFGQGPGEIMHPEKIIWVDDQVWLFSHESRKIVVFDRDTADYVETIRIQAPGFAVGIWNQHLIMAGQSPGLQDFDNRVIHLAPLRQTPKGRLAVVDRHGKAFIAPSILAQKAQGWMQQHVALWVPEQETLFYGDPLDFSALSRVHLQTGQVTPVILTSVSLAVWDGRKPIQQAILELDLYHPAGHFFLETPGEDFLFVTWRRAGGDFFTAILDCAANAPAGAIEGQHFPVGALEDRMVFFDEDGLLLLKPLADVFREGVGRNPPPR